jgi:hypothetical protein
VQLLGIVTGASPVQWKVALPSELLSMVPSGTPFGSSQTPVASSVAQRTPFFERVCRVGPPGVKLTAMTPFE